LYSWGSGFNYVLGNKDDETEYKPFEIKEGFMPKKVADLSLGT